MPACKKISLGEQSAIYEKDFPGTRIIKLEQNYRSSKKIIDVANKIISKKDEQPSEAQIKFAEIKQPEQIIVKKPYGKHLIL